MNKITSLQFLYKHPIWNILFDYQDIKNFYVCGGYIRDYILYGNGGKDIMVRQMAYHKEVYCRILLLK